MPTVTKEQHENDKVIISPSSSSCLLLIQEAAEKCLLLDQSVLLESDFVLSSLPVDVDDDDGTNNTSRKSAAAAAVATAAAAPLRVTCYGSSSSQTPLVYLQEAATLGFLLAIRGHTCVNGAGSFGCMAAMNDGAAAGNGHIVGVIHEMWLVDGPEGGAADDDNDDDDDSSSKTREWKTVRPLRDGGAHRIFEQQDESSSSLGMTRKKGPCREMLVAGGKDLQERKRLLVDKADALIVLPGGPGTWDELWEMACARNIGLTQLPIVCVNTNGFYEPFKEMLQRAWEDQLTKLEPHQILHFSETAQEAVQWVEEVVAAAAAAVAAGEEESVMRANELPRLQKRTAALRRASVLKGPITERSNDDFSLFQSIRRSFSNVSDVFLGAHDENDTTTTTRTRVSVAVLVPSLVFVTGVAVGFLLSERRQHQQQERQPSLGRFSSK